ncbi:MAG TPA: hypothetical protein VFF60_11000 [Candidatus Binatus sp.]|nr:hypothetical protein [Candidatus Binatus sp.]
MNWEAVTAVSTAFTGLVIFFTVIFARHQLQLTRQQLEQLRKASQLEGAVAVFADIDAPKVEEGRQFVLHELRERMRDPKFRDELRLIALVDENVHKELIVLRAYERVGAYIDEGLIDAEVVYLGAVGRIMSTWIALKEVVAIHRQLAPWAWMSYEHLANGAREWATARGGDPQSYDQLFGQVLGSNEKG